MPFQNKAWLKTVKLGEKNMFTKGDIRADMAVITRDGNKYLIKEALSGGYILVPFSDKKNALGLGEYRPNLTHYFLEFNESASRKMDIMVVFARPSSLDRLLSPNLRKYRNIIWERREEKPIQEYTQEELVKIVGHEFKLKVGKNNDD